MKRSVRYLTFPLFIAIFVLIIYAANQQRQEKRAVSEVISGATTASDVLARHEVKERLRLIGKMVGGLGNQLWIYAAIYGLSQMTNRPVYICSDINDTVNAMFPHLASRVLPGPECDGVTQTRPNTSVVLMQYYSALYFDIPLISKIRDCRRHVYVCCYLQNLGFFLAYEDSIKQQLRLADDYTQNAQNQLLDLSKKNAEKRGLELGSDARGQLTLNQTTMTYVMVHVRRGDMSREKGVVTPELPYFSKAMGYFRHKYGPSTLFVVATADLEWSRTNLEAEDVVFTGDLGPMGYDQDFAIALQCNHTIMSIGTFGWWMGYLTGGEVVYFGNWTGTSRFVNYYLPGQRYPYTWIEL